MHYSFISSTLCKRPARQVMKDKSQAESPDGIIPLNRQQSGIWWRILPYVFQPCCSRSLLAKSACARRGHFVHLPTPAAFCCVGTYDLCCRSWNKRGREWGHRYRSWPHIWPVAFHQSSLLRSGLRWASLLRSRSPCQDFQAECQSRGSGVLEACSLVKYLSYVIDVSTVINLAAAHPSSWPVPAQLHGGL